jgi:hypothetical protein
MRASLSAKTEGSTCRLPKLFLDKGASEMFGVFGLGEGLSSMAEIKKDVCPKVALCSSAC